MNGFYDCGQYGRNLRRRHLTGNKGTYRPCTVRHVSMTVSVCTETTNKDQPKKEFPRVCMYCIPMLIVRLRNYQTNYDAIKSAMYDIFAVPVHMYAVFPN